MKKNEIHDHPDVARALRTGYPDMVKCVRCTDCGMELQGDDSVYLIDGDLVCEVCTKDRLLDAYGVADIASAFDIYGCTARECIENQEDRS